MKPVIKIRYQNGIIKNTADNEILSELKDEFIFEESENPDFILFGPYGIDVPEPGNYTRIGYFCENIKPDLSICEWAFGVPREEDVKSDKYTRIQWHNLNPQSLIKPPDFDAERILASKTKFCNFLYGHPVPYREAFFKQLSKYKKVDAPGHSMNNMPGIDTLTHVDRWDTKRTFLSDYKFTIAFENDIYSGYQTEKLYDAMQAVSVPIYFGDPYIGEIFNTKSFINVPDCLPQKNKKLINLLEKKGQMDFEDILPAYLTSPKHRIKRRAKRFIRELKINVQFSGMDFSPVIDRIIALDTQPELYLQYLREPWFNDNAVPEKTSLKKRWIEIFTSR